jgi:hypothetical protein
VTTRLASTSGAAPRITLQPPNAARQVRFYQLLVAARKQWFIDVLSEALGQADQDVVQQQIREFVPSEVRRILAAAGLRDEHVFPVPAVLEIKPSLIGYYRLLLGAPQKSFYKGSTGMGRFKGMEELGTISRQAPYLSEFCRAMTQPLAELVRQIPRMTERDLRELPLLTFGSQLQGSNNTQIGKAAMKEVFLANEGDCRWAYSGVNRTWPDDSELRRQGGSACAAARSRHPHRRAGGGSHSTATCD